MADLDTNRGEESVEKACWEGWTLLFYYLFGVLKCKCRLENFGGTVVPLALGHLDRTDNSARRSHATTSQMMVSWYLLSFKSGKEGLSPCEAIVPAWALSPKALAFWPEEWEPVHPWAFPADCTCLQFYNWQWEARMDGWMSHPACGIYPGHWKQTQDFGRDMSKAACLFHPMSQCCSMRKRIENGHVEIQGTSGKPTHSEL